MPIRYKIKIIIENVLLLIMLSKSKPSLYPLAVGASRSYLCWRSVPWAAAAVVVVSASGVVLLRRRRPRGAVESPALLLRLPASLPLMRRGALAQQHRRSFPSEGGDDDDEGRERAAQRAQR